MCQQDQNAGTIQPTPKKTLFLRHTKMTKSHFTTYLLSEAKIETHKNKWQGNAKPHTQQSKHGCEWYLGGEKH